MIKLKYNISCFINITGKSFPVPHTFIVINSLHRIIYFNSSIIRFIITCQVRCQITCRAITRNRSYQQMIVCYYGVSNHLFMYYINKVNLHLLKLKIYVEIPHLFDKTTNNLTQ